MLRPLTLFLGRKCDLVSRCLHISSRLQVYIHNVHLGSGQGQAFCPSLGGIFLRGWLVPILAKRSVYSFTVPYGFTGLSLLLIKAYLFTYLSLYSFLSILFEGWPCTGWRITGWPINKHCIFSVEHLTSAAQLQAELVLTTFSVDCANASVRCSRILCYPAQPSLCCSAAPQFEWFSCHHCHTSDIWWPFPELKMLIILFHFLFS